jgi:hypothetical protein
MVIITVIALSSNFYYMSELLLAIYSWLYYK